MAGGLLEEGMPRRSVRRQIAEAAVGRADELLDAAQDAFARGSQGTRLACLMAVQDFGNLGIHPKGEPPPHHVLGFANDFTI